MVTIQDIRIMARTAGVEHGQLMRLARECEEDATLPSLAHLSTRGLAQLYQLLVAIRFGRSDVKRLVEV